MDDDIAEAADALNQRIRDAIGLAVQCGGIDGAHHKAWVIDQMVRALTGCTPEDAYRTYPDEGLSDEYRRVVADACAGEDGPETYSWDTGIAP